MPLPKPYYEHAGQTIYCGDCRDILPELPKVDSIITDPMWPNGSTFLPGSENPEELFRQAALCFPQADRVIVQLGCDSDPRFLHALSRKWPFFRVCWLEYACPTRKGRLLHTGDVAYVFGVPPASRPGRRVMPGRCISTQADAQRKRLTRHKEWGRPVSDLHPCPRRYEHVRYLVSHYADGLVLDPFVGSGTTLLAAKQCGYDAIGIEISPEYCEIAAKRLAQEVFDFTE